ncbi:pentapeptide repeat-containing protein [Streptomyces cyaneofuscatus]|uniref:pentapeptide repeat-containing protein n=1 Tax=Streptomyces cyaneofuscatus TaxID=66883 RepID=UPI003CF6C7F7
MKRIAKALGAILFGLLIVALTCGYGWLLWKGPWYFDRPHLRQRDLQPADGVVITGFRTMLVALGAGLITVISLWYTSRNHRLAREQFTQTQEQFQLAQRQFDHAQEQFAHTQRKDREQLEAVREGQVADRYVEAIKLLSSDSITQRLGGIYSIERIMKDSARDASTVVEVLAAFIRKPPARDEVDVISASEMLIGEDVQAAVTVLGRIPEDGIGGVVNLSGAHLRGAQLDRARMDLWDLRFADLSKSKLRWASIVGANLEGADLEGADLYSASLVKSDMSQVKLADASLWGVDMRETVLFGADLSKCINVNRDKLLESFILFSTKLPEDFDVDEEIEQRMHKCERVADGRDPFNV